MNPKGISGWLVWMTSKSERNEDGRVIAKELDGVVSGGNRGAFM